MALTGLNINNPNHCLAERLLHRIWIERDCSHLGIVCCCYHLKPLWLHSELWNPLKPIKKTTTTYNWVFSQFLKNSFSFFSLFVFFFLDSSTMFSSLKRCDYGSFISFHTHTANAHWIWKRLGWLENFQLPFSDFPPSLPPFHPPSFFPSSVFPSLPPSSPPSPPAQWVFRTDFALAPG